MAETTPEIDVAGPYYEDLTAGQRFDEAPGLTLTAGHAVVHQAALGDRLRLALDGHLAEQVLGPGPMLAHPGLVCDVAIGQSTLATQRAIANLFYRGLTLLTYPRIGDTLRTATEVVAMRDNTYRPNRRPTGLVLFRVRTVDQMGRPVLDFHRCAMLPMRGEEARPGHCDALERAPQKLSHEQLLRSIQGFDLARFRELVPGVHGGSVDPGVRYVLESGDTVSSAPELVRMTLNLAAAHVDPSAAGRGERLVYGGHTIGIALGHVLRAIPNLVTVAGWHSCDHVGPVFEGDVLRSTLTVDGVARLGRGTTLLELHVETTATRAGEDTAALDWRLVGVMAT